MKYYLGLMLLLSSMFLTSCFEIIEEVTLNDDGTGNVSLTLNFSKSKTKISSIMLMDSINNYKVPSRSEIKTQFAKLKNEVQKIKGVSNLESTSNFDDFIFTLSCDFTNVDVLNKIVSHFSSLHDSKIIANKKHFSYNKKSKTYTRNYHYDLAKEFKKVKAKDKSIIDGASITTVYRFESEIATSKNKKARISGSKKAIMLKVNAQDIISEKNTIKNTIQLK